MSAALVDEIARLRAELTEARLTLAAVEQERDIAKAMLSAAVQQAEEARAALQTKRSPAAMDLVGQRLVNARRSLDADAPLWLTSAMDEAWAVLAFLRRNSEQQAGRIGRQDQEITELTNACDEARLTLAAEHGRQEGAPSSRWHYVGDPNGFGKERGEWRRIDGAVKVWWDNGRWIWGRRSQFGVYVAERGQPDAQPARAAMLAADAAVTP